MEATSFASRGSRRAFIAAGLGGLAATAAHALGRPLPAQAGHDGTNVLHIGQTNVAPQGATTSLLTDVADSGATGFGVNNPNGQAVVGSSASGIGVFGSCDTGQGGQFHSVSGRGVLGKSQSYAGVQGTSDTGNGGEFFSGELAQGNAFGVLGVSGSGEGGHFQSTSGNGCVGSSETGDGVFGHCTGDGTSGNSIGVHGSSANIGVNGDSTGGVGVWGTTESGQGVWGESQSGIGGRFQSQSGMGVQGISPGAVPAIQAWSADLETLADDGGLALDVRGKARFSTAGSGTVPAGQNAVLVSNDTVTADSHITVTLVGDPGPRQLHWVARQPTVGFTVQLTSAPLNKRPETTFTYLVVEPA